MILSCILVTRLEHILHISAFTSRISSLLASNRVSVFTYLHLSAKLTSTTNKKNYKRRIVTLTTTSFALLFLQHFLWTRLATVSGMNLVSEGKFQFVMKIILVMMSLCLKIIPS